jgi:DnaJ-class molecular chaperone
MSFNLDQSKLEKAYKKLQWQVHPDRLATHSQVGTRSTKRYRVWNATEHEVAGGGWI